MKITKIVKISFLIVSAIVIIIGISEYRTRLDRLEIALGDYGTEIYSRQFPEEMGFTHQVFYEGWEGFWHQLTSLPHAAPLAFGLGFLFGGIILLSVYSMAQGYDANVEDKQKRVGE